ncbi:c-type cytochrome [Pirellulales bacterium]|nr:c-type cytochrome [Pirellulales bacterium]
MNLLRSRFHRAERGGSAAMLATSIVLGTALAVSSAWGQQGWPPEEAVGKLHVADGLQLELFAAEPLVRQPVTMSVDDRDRVWVIQYLQYPEPAGLKKVSGDRYDRNRYDRVPKPPPHGPRGADRITILEDSDGDGRADSGHDFVDGLNLASGLALGRGGVWVLQSPYLLFYPDRDQDDRPDGDPEVRLTGFGLDDAHSVANSLQWGPDGWLYGVHGSTANANVRGIGFQQGIWRYHPETDRFELFSEGGGNTYGLDFDGQGNAIAGTNWGLVGLHQMQGGYHIKNFGKHGALHNPYTFGYFQHMPHEGENLGKLSVGGVFYQARQWPARFHDQLITANPLNHAVYAINVLGQGSTFSTRFQERVMWSDDAWFQPVDLALEADGSMLVADWYDGNINYQVTYRNRDNFDPARGRIYRISAATPPDGRVNDAPSIRELSTGESSTGELSTGELSTGELSTGELSTGESSTGELFDLNSLRARRVLESLADRRDAEAAPQFLKVLRESRDQRQALHALWAVNLCLDLQQDDALAIRCLQHRYPAVRSWTVRLLGDQRQVAPAILEQLLCMARDETDVRVRAQLACTAKRLPGDDCLAIAAELARHDQDAEDAYLPMLLWWAVESKAVTHRERLLTWLADAEPWSRPLVSGTIVPRLARRYAAEGGDAGFATCAQLLALAPTAPHVRQVIGGMEQQLQGLKQGTMPEALRAPLAKMWERGSPPLPLVLFSVRMGSAEAMHEALARIADRTISAPDRAALIESLGQAGNVKAVQPLIEALQDSELHAIRSAALAALARYQEPAIAPAILQTYPTLDKALRNEARHVLYSRADWTRQLLEAIDQGQFNLVEIQHHELSQLLTHTDEAVRGLVDKHWGQIRVETPKEKHERMVELGEILAEGQGEAMRGKAQFKNLCAKCHQLHGEGERIGPDLTPYPRHELAYLLLHTVDPSAVIRPAYQTVRIATDDGRTLTGLLAETTPKTLTLLTAENKRILVARDEIEQMEDSSVSLMPDKLFADFSEQQIRDLFAYLQSGTSEPLRRDLSGLARPK